MLNDFCKDVNYGQLAREKQFSLKIAENSLWSRTSLTRPISVFDKEDISSASFVIEGDIDGAGDDHNRMRCADQGRQLDARSGVGREPQEFAPKVAVDRVRRWS